MWSCWSEPQAILWFIWSLVKWQFRPMAWWQRTPSRPMARWPHSSFLTWYGASHQPSRQHQKHKNNLSTSNLTYLPICSWQETNINTQVLLKGMRLAAAVTLNKWVMQLKIIQRVINGVKRLQSDFLFGCFCNRMSLTLSTSYVGDFQVRSGSLLLLLLFVHSFIYLISLSSKAVFWGNIWYTEPYAHWPLTSTPLHNIKVRTLDSILQMVLKLVVIPTVNGERKNLTRKMSI